MCKNQVIGSMEYRKRFLESKIEAAAKHFKAVMILGSRQVGKSTLLRHYLPEAESFVFDSVLDPLNVRSDPDLFLSMDARKFGPFRAEMNRAI